MTRRLQKFIVVGGKRPKKSGRILSTHRKLSKAKQSVEKYRKKGYHGCLWQKTKREKAGSRLTFAPKGKEFWLGKQIF